MTFDDETTIKFTDGSTLVKIAGSNSIINFSYFCGLHEIVYENGTFAGSGSSFGSYTLKVNEQDIGSPVDYVKLVVVTNFAITILTAMKFVKYAKVCRHRQ